MEHRHEFGLGFKTSGWPLSGDKPTLVFIHGAGGSSELWTNQVDALSGLANTIALDLPGHGASGNEGKSAIVDYAGAVAEFVEKMELNRPIPVGLSMGGAITQQLALDRPDLFPAIALVSTGAKLAVLPLIFDTVKNDFEKFITLMKGFSGSPKTPKEVLKPVIDDTARQSPSVIFGDFTACDNFDVRERLGEIKMPVLIVSGQDDQLTPPKYSDHLEKTISGSRLVRVENSGHIIPYEKPEELNKALSDFVADIAGG